MGCGMNHPSEKRNHPLSDKLITSDPSNLEGAVLHLTRVYVSVSLSCLQCLCKPHYPRTSILNWLTWDPLWHFLKVRELRCDSGRMTIRSTSLSVYSISQKLPNWQDIKTASYGSAKVPAQRWHILELGSALCTVNPVSYLGDFVLCLIQNLGSARLEV